MNFKANYEVLSLSGTQDESVHGDGVTASTTHQIFCLTTGSISITPKKGNSFTWSATAGQSIDVLIQSTTVSSGSFIGFKDKHIPTQLFY